MKSLIHSVTQHQSPSPTQPTHSPPPPQHSPVHSPRPCNFNSSSSSSSSASTSPKLDPHSALKPNAHRSFEGNLLDVSGLCLITALIFSAGYYSVPIVTIKRIWIALVLSFFCQIFSHFLITLKRDKQVRPSWHWNSLEPQSVLYLLYLKCLEWGSCWKGLNSKLKGSFEHKMVQFFTFLSLFGFCI